MNRQLHHDRNFQHHPLGMIFCLMAIFYSLTAKAQQDSLALEDLQEVFIQNDRLQIPFAKQNRDIRVIDQADIKRLPARTVTDVLNTIAGIDVRERGVMGSQADIGINGGTFDQTLILLNGAKIIDPQTGHLMMNLPVNLNTVKRIEVLKGPAASAYGVNAINGAINIVTRQPNKTGVMADVNAGSSFKKDTTDHRLYAGLSVEASASLSTDKTNQLLSLSTIQSNGYRHNSDIDNTKVFYSNHLDFNKKNSLKIMGGYVSNDYGANGFYSAPKDTEATEKVQTTLASAQGQFKLTDYWTFKPGLSYRYNTDHYVLDQSQPSLYQNKHYTNVFEASLNNTFYTGIGRFGFGLDYRNDKISSNSLGHHSRNNLGIFANYNWNNVPNLTVNLGLYANYNDAYGWDWFPSLDAGYQLNRSLRVYANAGTGMRLPTYTDLYYRGPVNVGYADLSPETSWQTEGGLKYHRSRLHISASYFYRKTDDFIDWAKDSLESPWQSRNYFRMKTQGISLSAQYAVIKPAQETQIGLTTGLSYTYLDPDLSEQDQGHAGFRYSQYGIDNLRHQLTGKATVQFLNNFQFTVSGKYEERVSYKDYVLFNARLSAHIDQFEIYTDVDNLTNVTYSEAGVVQLPGRWVTLGIKWAWWKS